LKLDSAGSPSALIDAVNPALCNALQMASQKRELDRCSNGNT
jgi:hypothetical protein